jgi:hypothetical protein
MTVEDQVKEINRWCRDVLLVIALGVIMNVLAKDGCGTGQHPAYVHMGSNIRESR